MVGMATDTPQAARTQAIRLVLREQANNVWKERLIARMDALGIETQELADGAGTTYQTIWKIRRGELYPREYLRISIALVLGAEVEQVFPMPSRATLVAAAERKAAA